MRPKKKRKKRKRRRERRRKERRGPRDGILHAGMCAPLYPQVGGEKREKKKEKGEKKRNSIQSQKRTWCKRQDRKRMDSKGKYRNYRHHGSAQIHFLHHAPGEQVEGHRSSPLSLVSMWWVHSSVSGVCFSLSTSLLLLFALYCQCAIILFPMHGGALNGPSLLYITITLLAFASHVKAQFSDPGACTLDPDACPSPSPSSSSSPTAAAAPPAPRVCRRCLSYKPPSAHHCSQCKRCIVKMNHHW